MHIIIEPATTDDAEALVKIQIAAFHYDSVLYPHVETGGPPGYDSVGLLKSKIEKHDCYKIMLEGQHIGGIVVFDEGQGHFHLDVIYIHPDYHNHGFGTQAIQFLDKHYAAKKWTLDTPDWAVRNRHFYEKLGYVAVGEHHDDDITLIAYERIP